MTGQRYHDEGWDPVRDEADRERWMNPPEPFDPPDPEDLADLTDPEVPTAWRLAFCNPLDFIDPGDPPDESGQAVLVRDWTAARDKVNAEGSCRACGSSLRLQAAHIIPRSRVGVAGQNARNIIPLCLECHAAQHAGHLELLPLLSFEEQAYAVSLVGLAEAYRRTTASESRVADGER